VKSGDLVMISLDEMYLPNYLEGKVGVVIDSDNSIFVSEKGENSVVTIMTYSDEYSAECWTLGIKHLEVISEGG